MARTFSGIIAVTVLTFSLSMVGEHCAAEQAKAEQAPKRKVLVFSMTKGFRHTSIPVAKEVLKEIGNQSGAYEAVVSDELENFDRERLFEFDCVIFNLTTGEIPLSDQQKQNLLEFVSGGRGFVGTHSATDTFYKWEEFGEMIGGYFDGHPWNANDTVHICCEQENAITQPFGERCLDLTEEIYQFRAPYDRSKLNVIMSLDVENTDMTKPGIKRTDKDFAVAWTKPYGQGRVFYTSLGHNEAVWKDARVQGHLLAGIRWAMGDIELEPSLSGRD
jgi:uncharacterized protein